jgi:hypothetical membrane protein
MVSNLLERPIIWRLNLSGLLACAGILGPAIFIATDLIAGLNSPFYNYFRHSISSLAWSNLGWLQTIGFLATGLLVELFVAGLFFGLKGRRGFGFSILLLVMFGFGLLLIGAFHTDPYVGPHTIEGDIHLTSAKIVFWTLPTAALLIVPSLRQNAFWKSLCVYSIISAILAFLLMTGSVLWMKDDFRWFGLFERLLVVIEISWVVVMAIWLLRLSLKTTRPAAIKPVSQAVPDGVQ